MTDRQIFRKAALARLSSPEQLDTLLAVTSPRSWLALAGLIGLIVAVGAWGIWGTIATKATGTGVIMRTGGVFNVVTQSAGQVLELYVEVGDTVEPDQVIARVAQPELVERIQLARGRLDYAQAERSRVARMRGETIQLKLVALERRQQAHEEEIQARAEQARMLEQQIPVQEELLERGLIIREQLVLTRQQLGSIQSGISSIRAQIAGVEAERFETENAQFEPDLQAQSRIAELQRDLDMLDYEFDSSSKVVTPRGGLVLERKVFAGNLVVPGSPIVSLQSRDLLLEAVFYVEAAQAKSIQKNMAVEVSPSTVRREEFGFIRGRVMRVSDFPATEDALLRLFENPPLVRELAGAGPVHEVRVQLERDPESPDGYLWSSTKGAGLTISGGTICTGEIVTRQQRPISLVFPFVRQLVGVG